MDDLAPDKLFLCIFIRLKDSFLKNLGRGFTLRKVKVVFNFRVTHYLPPLRSKPWDVEGLTTIGEGEGLGWEVGVDLFLA